MLLKDLQWTDPPEGGHKKIRMIMNKANDNSPQFSGEFDYLKNICAPLSFAEIKSSKDLYGSEASLPILCLKTEAFTAEISIQGAQLLSFRPKGQNDWLWLSPHAVFAPDKAIRGGVPICAPWFGPHPERKDLPKHGFVRHQNWRLCYVEQSSNTVELKLEFSHQGDATYENDFIAILCIRLNHQLQFYLSFQNRSELPMPLTFALHSYFVVQDLGTVKVQGLAGNSYVDTVGGANQRCEQEGPILFTGEVDRVYEGIQSNQIIEQSTSLEISGDACPTVIVWNPGRELATTMADVGEQGYQEYICVERGAAWADALCLDAKSSYEASMEIARVD